ncbi:cyclophilin-like fold protein [Paraburkholderia sp. SIMBA_049]
MHKLYRRLSPVILAAVLSAGYTTASSSEKQNDTVKPVGTVVRFTAGSTLVDVTIRQDNPAVRDFLSMLPLNLTLKEFAGREKIGYLPRKLKHSGSPGSDPVDGDLIYYVPWGNIGFYYNASGIGYSDDTINLGTYKASPEQLKMLEGRPVTVQIVQ